MRPRTAQEKEVVALSATLPPISDKEIDEARRSHNHMYHSSASSWCDHCGHVWNQDV